MNPRIDLLTKVIPLKLFLDMVPGSSAELTRTLRGCFRGGFDGLCLFSFCFKAKETLQGCEGVFFDHFNHNQRSFGSRYMF